MMCSEIMLKQVSIPCINYKLQADWYLGRIPDEVILTFVGFGSSKERNADFMKNIVEKTGMSALVVDLSGHGESNFDSNETTPLQHISEAVMAYDWIRAEYLKSKIHVMGTSYGGFIASYLTRFRKVCNVVLRTPAIYEPQSLCTKHKDIDKVAARGYRSDSELVGKHPLFAHPVVSEFPTLLIVHGEDKSVPAQTTDVYREKLNADVYVAKGFAHSFRDPSNPQDDIDMYYDVISNHFMQSKL